MRIAIDLLWLRVKKVGGTEFYIRNLLNGFVQIKEKYEFILLVSEDNRESFERYLEDDRFSILTAPIKSVNIGKRIIWQNLFQNRLLKKNGIRHCFVPVYCRPFLNGGICYINTIHDIQAYHYPEYHPAYEIWYSKLCWYTDFYKSKRVIATTNYVKDDLINIYKVKRDKIDVLYIPVTVDRNEMVDFAMLKEKFGIDRYKYFYTVSQLIPHKNILTLVKVMANIKEKKNNLPCKLLISGINGNAAEEIRQIVIESGMEEHITLTGFISNEERNSLYSNARAFLFPSVFEGFGIPPVEAMMFGTAVVTTECASIPEVTQNKANYVKDPYDVEEWTMKIEQAENNSNELDISLFDPVKLAHNYIALLQKNFI